MEPRIESRSGSWGRCVGVLDLWHLGRAASGVVHARSARAHRCRGRRRLAIAFTLTTPFTLDEILYEIVSAFATVGLSTGITADLPTPHQLVLVALMFIGRTGTITLATAMALRHRDRRYRLPEERPIIG